MLYFQQINGINLIIYADSVLIAQILGGTFPKRQWYIPRLVLGTLLFGAAAYAFPFLQIDSFWGAWAYSIFMYVFLLGLPILAVAVCVKAKWINYLFCAVAGYASHHTIATLEGLLNSLVFGETTKGFFSVSALILHSVLLCITYAVIILHFHRNRSIRTLMDKRRVVLITLLIVLVSIVISSLVTLADYYSAPMISAIPAIYNLTTSILALAFLFGLMEQEMLEREVEIINKLYKENMRQYEISKSTMASLHDLKHRINSIMEGRLALSEEERKDVSDQVFIFDSMIKTGNETLDIILTENMLLCRQHDIEFDCMADGSRLSFMDVYDIYSLFGNAISNAIEAVRRQEEGHARLIALFIKGSSQHVSIHIENTFSGQITISEGMPETNKEDKLSHGFGIKSMCNIVNKYDGNITITIDDDIFNLDILFHL